LSLIRDRLVRIPRLENVDRHFVPVSDFLPADEEMGQEGSGIGHLTTLTGVKGISVGLLPLNISCTPAEQRDPVHTLLKKTTFGLGQAAPRITAPSRFSVTDDTAATSPR
jgi:hypothetical protein